MSKKYTTTKTCIYCGAQAGSKEHVFPEWLRDRFTGVGTLEYKEDIDSPIRFKKGVRDLRVTVRSVCKKCNEHWMSVLQNDTKPLILSLLDSPTTTLDLMDCKLLTSWAVMSMMCLETRNRRAIWRYSELDHTLFYTNKEIPKNTEVWICHWKNSPGSFYEGRVLGMNHDRAFVTTFGFGNLVFQVLHVVPVDPNDGKTMWMSTTLPWDEILIPIRYPKDVATNWPPKKSITGEPDFDALESRFSRTR